MNYALRNFEILLSKKKLGLKYKVGFPDAFANPADLLQNKCIKDFKIAQQEFCHILIPNK